MQDKKGLGRPAVTIGGEVERIDGRDLSYDEFAERYLKPNRPIALTGLMDDWRTAADWLAPDGRGPNFHFFADDFGKSVVRVADCSTKEFTDQKRQEMTVAEFISYWLKLSLEKGRSVLCNDESKPLLYLKDWHFNKVGLTAGLEMFVGGNIGSFYHLPSVTLCLIEPWASLFLEDQWPI